MIIMDSAADAQTPFTPYYDAQKRLCKARDPRSIVAASAAGAPHSTSQTLVGPGCMQNAAPARRQKNVDRLEKHARSRLRCHPFIRLTRPQPTHDHLTFHLSRLACFWLQPGTLYVSWRSSLRSSSGVDKGYER